MKKRLLSALLVLCMVLMLLPGTAWAAETSGPCGDGVTWSYSNGTLTIQGGGSMDRFASPDDDFDVYITHPWEDYINQIHTIIIDNGVTSIGEYAFWICSGLTSVTIPDSVTSIGEYAFSNCSNLASVTIPNSVTSIGTAAFGWCNSLANVTIPSSVTTIGSLAFYDCSSLTSVTIPNSITNIEDYAFSNCSSLTDVYYSGSETDWKSIIISSWGNSDLTNAKIHYNSTGNSTPDVSTAGGKIVSGTCGDHLTWTLDDDGTLTISGMGAMDYTYRTPLASYAPWEDYRTNIQKVIIEDGATSIGDGAFHHCTNLASIIIPESVSSIGKDAFLTCTSLTSITIPNSVTSIGEDAFSACSSLTSITIPNSVTSISKGTFWACSGLSSITIPNSVTSIGDNAFMACASLTSIAIPNSVTSIGNSAFCKCGLTSITIPISVTSIGEYAFDECMNLASVIIPSSVTNIGERAFSLCRNLSSITIPNSVINIGDYAFWDCTNLANITIPGSVTSIGDYAFSDCSSLTDVYYSGAETDWKAISVGSYNGGLTNAKIHYNSTGPDIAGPYGTNFHILIYASKPLLANKVGDVIDFCCGIYTNDGQAIGWTNPYIVTDKPDLVYVSTYYEEDSLAYFQVKGMAEGSCTLTITDSATGIYGKVDLTFGSGVTSTKSYRIDQVPDFVVDESTWLFGEAKTQTNFYNVNGLYVRPCLKNNKALC